MSEQQQEPWQWSDAHWQKIVAQARAGKKLAPRIWPITAKLHHCGIRGTAAALL